MFELTWLDSREKVVRKFPKQIFRKLFETKSREI